MILQDGMHMRLYCIYHAATPYPPADVGHPLCCTLCSPPHTQALLEADWPVALLLRGLAMELHEPDPNVAEMVSEYRWGGVGACGARAVLCPFPL